MTFEDDSFFGEPTKKNGEALSFEDDSFFGDATPADSKPDSYDASRIAELEKKRDEISRKAGRGGIMGSSVSGSVELANINAQIDALKKNRLDDENRTFSFHGGSLKDMEVFEDGNGEAFAFDYEKMKKGEDPRIPISMAEYRSITSKTDDWHPGEQFVSKDEMLENKKERDAENARKSVNRSASKYFEERFGKAKERVDVPAEFLPAIVDEESKPELERLNAAEGRTIEHVDLPMHIVRDENGKIAGYMTTNSTVVPESDTLFDPEGKGHYSVIPTIRGTQGHTVEMTEDEAREYYRLHSGKRFGTFSSREEAVKAAQDIHNLHQRIYQQRWNQYINEHWDEVSDEIKADPGTAAAHMKWIEAGSPMAGYDAEEERERVRLAEEDAKAARQKRKEELEFRKKRGTLNDGEIEELAWLNGEKRERSVAEDTRWNLQAETGERNDSAAHAVAAYMLPGYKAVLADRARADQTRYERYLDGEYSEEDLKADPDLAAIVSGTLGREARKDAVRQYGYGMLANVNRVKDEAKASLQNTKLSWYKRVGTGAIQNTGYTLNFALAEVLGGGVGGILVPAATAAHERYGALTSNEYGFGENGELIVSELADSATEAGAKAIIGGLAEAAVERYLEVLGAPIAKSALAKTVRGKVMRKLAEASASGNKVARTIPNIVRGYGKLAKFTGVNSAPWEVLEEDAQAILDEVIGLENRRDSRSGLINGGNVREAWSGSDQLSWKGQLDVFLSMLGTMAFQAGVGGVIDHYVNKDARNELKKHAETIYDLPIDRKYADAMSDREKAKFVSIYNKYANNPDKLAESANRMFGKNGVLEIALRNVQARGNAEAATALAEVGERPAKLTIPTNEKGEVAFVPQVIFDSSTGKRVDGKMALDNANNIGIVDCGDGRFIVVDFDNGKQYSHDSLKDAKDAADGIILARQVRAKQAEMGVAPQGAETSENAPADAPVAEGANSQPEAAKPVETAVDASLAKKRAELRKRLENGETDTPEVLNLISEIGEAQGAAEEAAAQTAYEDDLVDQLPAMEARLKEMDANGADKSSREYKQLVSDINAAKKIASKRSEVKVVSKTETPTPTAARSSEAPAPSKGEERAPDADGEEASAKPKELPTDNMGVPVGNVGDSIELENGMTAELVTRKNGSKKWKITRGKRWTTDGGKTWHDGLKPGDRFTDDEYDTDKVPANAYFGNQKSESGIWEVDLISKDGEYALKPVPMSDENAPVSAPQKTEPTTPAPAEKPAEVKEIASPSKSGYIPYAPAEKHPQLAKVNESGVVSKLKMAGEKDAKNLVATTPKGQQLLDDAFALSKTFRGQMSKRLTEKLSRAGERTLEDAVDEAGHYIAIADGNVPQPLKDAFAKAQEKLVELKRTKGAMSGSERSKALSIAEFAKVPPEQGGARYDPDIEQILLGGGFFNPPNKDDVLWDYVRHHGMQSFVFKPQASKGSGGNDDTVIDLAKRLGFKTEVDGRGENTAAVAEQIIDAAFAERELYQRWKAEQDDNYRNDRLANAKAEVAEIAKGKRKTWLANATKADLDDLAEAQKRGEFDEDYANAVAFVENGADELDAAIVSPAMLKMAKPFWDRIRLDHQKKSFVFVDYDAKSGIMTVADDSGSGAITDKQIHYYEVTDKGFKEVENGSRNETGASGALPADAQKQGRDGEAESGQHDNRPSGEARRKHQRRYGILAGRGEGSIEGISEAVSALKNGEPIRAIDTDYSISSDDIREWQDSAVGEKIGSREDAAHIFMRLSNPIKEIPKVIYVAKDGTVIKASVHGVGTLGEARMDQRKVIDDAPDGCYGVIVSHNHPDGDVNPSRQDMLWTLALLEQDSGGIKIIDNIVTDTDRFVSIAEGSERWKPIDGLDGSIYVGKTTVPLPEDRFNIVPYDERLDLVKPLADGSVSASKRLRPMIEKIASVDKNGSYVILMEGNGVVNGVVAIPKDVSKLTGMVRGSCRFAVLVGTDEISRKDVSDALDAAVDYEGDAARDVQYGIVYSYSMTDGDYELKTGRHSNEEFVKLGKPVKPTTEKSSEFSKTKATALKKTPAKKSVSTKKPTGENAKKAADALARIKGVLNADTARLEQRFTSAKTSLPKNEPSLYKSAVFQSSLKRGGQNLDIGAGRTEYATKLLAEKGVKNATFDPFNRPQEVNARIIRDITSGKRFNTVTAANVLNVIAEPEVRDNVILEAAKAVSPNGRVFFDVYTAPRAGEVKGRDSFQTGMKPQEYIPEIEKHFGKVERSGSIVVASSPKVSSLSRKATWWDANPALGGNTTLYSPIEDTESRQLSKEEKRELRNATEDLVEALGGASFDEVARYIADADPALYHKFKPFLKNAYNSATDGDLTTVQAKKIYDKIDADLKEIDNDDQTAQQPADKLRGKEGDSREESRGTSGGRRDVSSPAGELGGRRIRGGRGGVGPRADADRDGGTEGDTGSESPEAQPRLGERTEQSGGLGTDGGVDRPAGGSVAGQGGAGDIQSAGGLDEVADGREEVTPGFMAYEPPADLPVKVPKSDNLIVETSALASVNVPPIVRKPDIDDSIPRDGILQAHQYQAVCQIVNAHERTLPSGERTGYLVADGTGSGKTRIIAGVMLDAVNRKLGGGKAVMISQNRTLFNDALKDFTPFGISNRLFELDKYGKDSPTRKRSTGIAFTTYNNLSDNYAGIGRDGEVKSTNKRGKADSRFGDLVKWLGKEFDGVIALDEAHTASKERDGRTSKQASYAQTVIDLQAAFPKARVVYLTATAAYNADDLRMLTRLGIWGKGTGFDTRNDFVSAADRGGMSMLEVLTQGLKARGLYCSRSISFKGVECKRVVHKLTDQQVAMYNQVRDTLARVFSAIHQAGGMCGLDGKEMGLKSRNFFGAAQNLINTMVTSFKTQTAIDLGRQALKDGKSPVFQLVTTNDAAKAFKAEEARRSQSLELVSDGEAEQEVSVKDNIIKFISGPTFPTREFLGRKKGAGAEWGSEVPDAVALQKEMLALARQLPDIGNPIDVLVKEFSDVGISEVKGGMPKNVRVAEVDKFNNGTNLALVFSGAGGTGSSYHADRRFKNQRQRVQIPIEFGWEPDKFIQALGRSHRNNQVMAPEFMLLSTDLAGENRFMSTIASRVSSMGAIVGGDRNSSGQVIGESDSLENKYGRAAVRDFASRVSSGTGYAGLSGSEILNGMHLDADKLDELTVKKFLARLLFLSPDQQNAIYGELMDKVDAAIAKAKEDGTYDNGIRKIDAKRVEIKNRESMSAGDNASQNRDLLTVGETYPSKRVTLDELRKRIPDTSRLSLMRNKRSKEVYAVIEGRNRTLRYSPNGSYEEIDALDLQNYEAVDRKTGETEWQKKYDAIPETRELVRHYMTGDLIPVWNKMGIEHPQVYRAQPYNARPFIGVFIPDNDLPSTLYGFGFKDRARQIFAENAFKDISRSTAITYGIGETEDAAMQPYFRNAKIGGQKVLAVIGAGWNRELLRYLGNNPNFQSAWYQDKGNYNDKGGTVYYIPFDAEGSAAEDAFEGVMGRFGIVKYANGKVAFATKDVGENGGRPKIADSDGDTSPADTEKATALGERLGMPKMRFAVDHGKLVIYGTEASRRDALKRAFGGTDAVSNRGKKYVKSDLRWDRDNGRWTIPLSDVPKALWDEIGEVEDLHTPIARVEQLDAETIRSLNDNADAMEATLLSNMLRADIVPLERANSGLSDKLLAQRAADDPSALGELYRRYMVDMNRTKGGLPGIVNRICAKYGIKPNTQLVEDVAAQVWSHPTRGIVREVSERPEVYRNYEFTTILFNKAQNLLKDLLEQMSKTGEVTLDQPNRADDRVDDVDQLVADNPDMASRLLGGYAADEQFSGRADWKGRRSREESITEARGVLSDIAYNLPDERGEMLRAMLKQFSVGSDEQKAAVGAAKEVGKPVGVFRNEWNALKDLIRTKKYLLPENMAGEFEGAAYSDEELMDMMPEAMASAVELRLQGMDAKQIAEKLGVTKENVREQLRRAVANYGISYPRIESPHEQYEFDFAWDAKFAKPVAPRQYAKKAKAPTKLVQDDLFGLSIDTSGKSVEDVAYEAAVASGDLDAAKRMLANKIGANNAGGVIPFVSAHLNYYNPNVRKVAYGLKAGLADDIAKAAPEMARMVPSDAVLVPMPSHNGYAEETIPLANAIAKIANVPVANVLKGKKRISMYDAKKSHTIPSRKELALSVKGDLPKGRRVFVVDNVVNTGMTAREAVDALDGKAVVISYAYSDADIAKVGGLKIADITYDNGRLIPLSSRFDAENSNVLFSEIAPLEGGISQLYTGSAADYEKPSLLKVGTGEGSQVYGWGLYASDRRGVAEGYANSERIKNANNNTNKIYAEVDKILRKEVKSQQQIDDIYEALDTTERWDDVKTNLIEGSFDEGSFDVFIKHEKEFKKIHDELVAHRNLYEQTFFTNRAPGDESHLLKWYEPVSEENWKRIISEARKEFDNGSSNVDPEYLEGIKANFSVNDGGRRIYEALSDRTLFGSPKAASEFLARADIDGIKYPVDSYGGKTVKDGDKAGWNYVSFRDDNITVDHKWRDGVQLYSAVEPLETIQAEIPDMIERARVYGMHNAAVDEFRKANGMPEIGRGRKMTREQILAPGEATANNEVEMEKLVSLHLANPKLPANADTQAAFTVYGVRLAGRIADLKDGMAEAVANGNMPLAEQLQAELDEAMVKYDRAAKASRNIGTQWAYAGLARQGKFSPDMSYAEYATAMNNAAGGKPSEKQKRVIEAVWNELHDKNIAVTDSHIRDIVRMIDESLVPAWLSKTVTDSVKQRRALSLKRIEEDYFEALRQARHHGQMTGGVLDGLPNGQKWIRAMIAYYVNSGSDIYDENGKPDNRKVVPLLQKDLEDCGIDATPYEIRQMESRMGNATQPSKDETSVTLRDLHAQMLVEQQIAYMLQFGELPPKTGWMRDKDSDIARRLRKERLETEKRLGLDSAKSERRLASLLDAAKTRVRNQIADIDEKIRILENGGTLPQSQTKPGLAPDEELLNLRSQLKMRKEILAGLDAEGEHENKVLRVLKALKRRAEALRERNDAAKANPTEDKFGKPERQKLNDPRIDAARKEIADLNKEFDDFKASLFPEGTQKEREAWHARRMAALAKSLDRWNAALNAYNSATTWEEKNKALHPIVRKPPRESEDTLKAKRSRDAAYRKVQDLRNKLERENTRGGRLMAAFNLASSAPALLRTVGDMSVALVQGGRGLNSHPILWSKALAAGTAAMFRKSSADRLVEGLKAHPYFDDFKDHGGHVYSMEGLEDGDIPEDFRLLGERVNIKNWPLVKQSARGFSGFLNHLNLSLYQAMVESAGSGNGGANDNIKRDIAKFVNITTGYGYEKKTDRKEILGVVANVLDGLAWAPRKAVAELKYATGLDMLEPYWGSRRSEKSAKDIRRAIGVIGKEKMRFTLGMIAYTIAATLIGNMLGGENDWEELLNPLSTDFLRPKIGNTRLRPAAGLEIVWRTLARLITGKTNSNGVTKETNRGDVLTRFVRGKLTPWIATAWDFFTGKTATGQDIKTSPGEIAKNYVLPLTWSSEWDNFAMNDPISAIAALLPIFYGGSAYTAKTDTLARADAQRKDLDARIDALKGDGTDDELVAELSAKENSEQYNSSVHAGEAIRLEKERVNLSKELADFQKRLSDVNDEITALRKRGLMPTERLSESKSEYEKAIVEIEEGISELDSAIPEIRKKAEDRVKAFRWGSVDSWRER